jgi:hypothetical protein
MKGHGKVRALAVATLMAGVVGAVGLTAGVAHAGVASPMRGVVPQAVGEQECEGNLCAKITNDESGVVTVRAWARYVTFTGHFQLQTPNRRSLNSIESTWHAGGTGNYFNDINGGNGTYCVTEWNKVIGGWNDIGYVCIST